MLRPKTPRDIGGGGSEKSHQLYGVISKPFSCHHIVSLNRVQSRESSLFRRNYRLLEVNGRMTIVVAFVVASAGVGLLSQIGHNWTRWSLGAIGRSDTADTSLRRQFQIDCSWHGCNRSQREYGSGGWSSFERIGAPDQMSDHWEYHYH